MPNKSKKSRKRPNKRSRKRSKKNRKMKANSINIDNTGLTEFIYKEGKQSPKKSTFKWNGNYNGQTAKIHMDFDVDGQKTQSNIKLNNQDLMNIIGSTDVVNQPIDQRLQLLDKDLSGVYPNTPINMSNTPINMSNTPINTPIFIHSGEMPMPSMSLEHEIIAVPMPLSMPMSLEHDIPKSKSKSSRKGKSKSKSKR
jgi:hypothetical protein